MRKYFVAAAIAVLAAGSAPAYAQWSPYSSGSGYGHGNGYRTDRGLVQQFRQVRNEITLAADRNRISDYQESRLLRRLELVSSLYRRYQWSGLTAYERQDILARLRQLRSEIWRGNGRQEGNWNRDNDRSWGNNNWRRQNDDDDNDNSGDGHDDDD